MATTEHYGITKINGTEDISPVPVNNAFDKIDSAIWNALTLHRLLTASDNLDTLTSEGTGFFVIGGDAPLNCPDGYLWSFLFQVVRNQFCNQCIIKPVSGSMIIREYSGSPSVWSTWKMVGGYTGITRINYGSNSYVDYWKSGQTGCLKISYAVSDGSINAWSTKQIATLPEGFRPATSILMRGIVDRPADEGTAFVIESSGAVKISTRTNAFNTSGDVLQGTLTFPIRY